MNNYQLPSWAELTVNITAIVVFVMLVLGAIVLCVWLIEASLESEKKKKEFIDTLDEHDKAVVMSYINAKKYPSWRRRVKK